MVDGSGGIFTVLAIIFKAKRSGKHQAVRNNFGSIRIALQSSRT